MCWPKSWLPDCCKLRGSRPIDMTRLPRQSLASALSCDITFAGRRYSGGLHLACSGYKRKSLAIRPGASVSLKVKSASFAAGCCRSGLAAMRFQFLSYPSRSRI
jgi:hypothetical protein